VKNGPYTTVESPPHPNQLLWKCEFPPSIPACHAGDPIVRHALEGISPPAPRMLTQKSALGSTWCFTQLLLHKIPLVLWFQSKTVAGVIVTVASALERVSVGCTQGLVGLPMAFLPHVKTVLFKGYNNFKWHGSEQAFQQAIMILIPSQYDPYEARKVKVTRMGQTNSCRFLS